MQYPMMAKGGMQFPGIDSMGGFLFLQQGNQSIPLTITPIGTGHIYHNKVGLPSRKVVFHKTRRKVN